MSEAVSVSKIKINSSANASYVFGGEIFGLGERLKGLLQKFLATISSADVSLETDFLHWLADNDCLNYSLSKEPKVWIDSDRDVVELISHMEN